MKSERPKKTAPKAVAPRHSKAAPASPSNFPPKAIPALGGKLEGLAGAALLCRGATAFGAVFFGRSDFIHALNAGLTRAKGAQVMADYGDASPRCNRKLQRSWL